MSPRLRLWVICTWSLGGFGPSVLSWRTRVIDWIEANFCQFAVLKEIRLLINSPPIASDTCQLASLYKAWCRPGQKKRTTQIPSCTPPDVLLRLSLRMWRYIWGFRASEWDRYIQWWRANFGGLSKQYNEVPPTYCDVMQECSIWGGVESVSDHM